MAQQTFSNAADLSSFIQSLQNVEAGGDIRKINELGLKFGLIDGGGGQQKQKRFRQPPSTSSSSFNMGTQKNSNSNINPTQKPGRRKRNRGKDGNVTLSQTTTPFEFGLPSSSSLSSPDSPTHPPAPAPTPTLKQSKSAENILTSNNNEIDEDDDEMSQTSVDSFMMRRRQHEESQQAQQRPATVSAISRKRQSPNTKHHSSPSALDLFEDDVVVAVPRAKTAKNVEDDFVAEFEFCAFNAEFESESKSESKSKTHIPSRRKSSIQFAANTKPESSGGGAPNLPEIFTNYTEDRNSSEFYSDVLQTEISDLYKTLNVRAKTKQPSTKRISTGGLVPSLSSVAASNDPAFTFQTFTHTLGETRSVSPTQSQKTRKRHDFSVYGGGEPGSLADVKKMRKPKRQKKLDFLSPMGAVTKNFTKIPRVTTANSKFLAAKLGLGEPSPYEDNDNDKPKSNRNTAATDAAADAAQETKNTMRDYKKILLTSLRDIKSRERTDFYNEITNINNFRKDLPLSYLAAAMLRTKERRKLEESSDENSSIYSHNSDSIYDSDELEIMKLACGKVVDGFMKMIVAYFGYAWKNLIRMRDCKRLLEKNAKAKKIQIWFKNMFIKIAVKRAKQKENQDELNRIEALRQLELLKVRRATDIQRVLWRGREGRKMAVFKRKLVAAARVIQRAWERKKCRGQGMTEVANFYLFQNSAVVLQCFARSYRARILLRKKRVAARHVERLKKYATSDSVIRTNFEMMGAASKIQRWWKRLPWRLLVFAKRYQALTVRQIQRWYRHVRARGTIVSILFERVGEMQRRNIFANKVSHVLRGGAVRQKLRREALFRANVARRKHDKVQIDEKLLLQQKLDHEKEQQELNPPPKKTFFQKLMGSAQQAHIGHEFNIHKHKKQQTIAATCIQKYTRRFFARKVIKKLRDEEFLKATLRIQKKIRLHAFRKARWKATFALEMIWIRVKRRRKRKAAAITKVQARYRGLKGRKKVKIMVAAYTPATIILQTLVRGIFAIRTVQQLRVRLRWEFENQVIGKKMYANSFQLEIMRQIFHHTTHFKNPAHKAEIQCLFGHYCSMGTRGNIERLGVRMFMKFAKESNFINESMKTQTLELLFAHEKGKDAFVKYPQFVSILKQIADAKYPKIFFHGKFKDTNARLLKLLQEMVLVTKSAKNFVKDLESERASERSTRHVNDCCELIQNCFLLSVKRAAQKKKFLSAELAMMNFARLKSLNSIQRSWRCALSRHHMRMFALKVYQKIIDDHNKGRAYYYNSLTGVAVWRKPIFLGKYDIANPIKMPDDDRLFKKPCDLCGRVSSCWYDILANESFCEECNIEVHSKGRLKGNMCVPIENCVQCEFQQATKKCKQCVDLYCDTCYYDQHKRGQLLKHDFTPINDHCVDCEKFVAMLLIEPTNECICKKCYKKRYPHDKTFTNPGKPGLSMKPHEHIPNAVDEYYESLKMDEEKRLIQIEFEERKARMLIILREKSAVLIQKSFRGLKGKRKGLIIMAARRQLRMQRLKDEKKRNSLKYSIKEYIGNAPELLSDTTLEKVVHRYPAWWKNLIIDCVDGDWEGALKMIEEQDKFMKFKESRGVFSVMRGGVGSAWRGSKRMIRKRNVSKSEMRKDKAMLAYRNARSAIGTNEAKKEELKMNMRKMKHKWKEAEKLMSDLEEKIKQKKDVLEEKKGPRRFEKLVRDIRASGKALKWRRREIVWDLKRGDEVLKIDQEKNPMAENIDLFGKKLIRIGTVLRLGNEEQHGLRYYKIVSNNKQPTLGENIANKIMSRLDADSFRKKMEAKRELLKLWDEQNIMLDHEWIGDTPTDDVQKMDNGFVHAMPRELYLNRLKFRIRFAMRSNFIVQRFVRRTFRLSYKWGNFLEDSSKKFDEDSAINNWLQKKTRQCRNYQRRVALHSMVWLDEDEKSSVLQQLDVGKGLYGKGKRLAIDAAKEIYKIVFKKKEKVVIDQFGKWDKSEEKVDVVVNWFDKNQDTEKLLGTLMMDVDAPASVAREYCRRFLRKELNTRSGENFMIFIRGEGMPLAEESGKRIGQLAPQKFNSKSKEVEHTLVLCENPSELLAKKDIPIIKSDARKAEDAAKLKKYMDSLLMESVDKELKDVLVDQEHMDELQKILINSGVKEAKVSALYNRKGKLMGGAYNEMTSDFDVKVRDALKAIIDGAMGVEHLVLDVDESEEKQSDFEVLSDEQKFEKEARESRELELKEQKEFAAKKEKMASNKAATEEEEKRAAKELQDAVDAKALAEMEEQSVSSSPSKSSIKERAEEEWEEPIAEEGGGGAAGK